MTKKILPSWIKEIKQFYMNNPWLPMPSDILKEYKWKPEGAYNSRDASIIWGLILARLIGIDPEVDVKNSDVILKVWEPPVYYVWNQKKWLRDDRFPVITSNLMELFFNNWTPTSNKDNLSQKMAHKNQYDVDEDFALSFEVNKNFDYNQLWENNELFYKKPQFEAVDISVDKTLVIWRFRVNLARDQGNKFFVFRKLEADIPDFYDLGLNQRFLDFITYKEGLVLVTWPTWSWKSTTLAAMINEINKHQYKNVITIEDPIEFVHKNKNSIFSQREVPTDTLSFANWLKSALREKPDIIMIWELRDLETIRLAIEAAETWHLVFWTLHTFNAAKTIDRLINSFPSEEQNKIAMSLSWCIVWIISQTLVKTQNWWITALNEMIKFNDTLRGHVANKNTPGVTQWASNNPIDCLTMVDCWFDLIKTQKVNQVEILNVLYKKDNPSYHLLVKKLQASALYKSEIDPYSAENQNNWKIILNDDDLYNLNKEKDWLNLNL